MRNELMWVIENASIERVWELISDPEFIPMWSDRESRLPAVASITTNDDGSWQVEATDGQRATYRASIDPENYTVQTWQIDGPTPQTNFFSLTASEGEIVVAWSVEMRLPSKFLSYLDRAATNEYMARSLANLARLAAGQSQPEAAL